ncbi:MAG: hypothetical protein CM1200mP26_07440 [Acidimicrobiales bacterium]|nr:MAG: hypothetical protein CM1200mP26_07440 [Acidimicrobiales bacterium]
MSGLDVEAVLAADLSDCADAPSGDPIRVGMAMDFSDVVGFVDIPGSKVVPFVAELINCAGGINGSPVRFVWPRSVTTRRWLLRNVGLGCPFLDWSTVRGLRVADSADDRWPGAVVRGGVDGADVG